MNVYICIYRNKDKYIGSVILCMLTTISIIKVNMAVKQTVYRSCELNMTLIYQS